MQRVRLTGLIALPLMLAPAAGLERPPGPDAEVERIAEHLATVAGELRTHVPAHLTAEQREARRITLDWLDEYRQAGVFPHNHVRGERAPVFVDPHGTPCAVGYLMLRSGHDELVTEIVRSDNLVRVPALRNDPRVRSWLESRGITLDEAARIQPAYGPWPDEEPPTTSGYVGATVGLTLMTAALASYTGMAGPDAGRPLVDVLTVGAALGHGYLMVDAQRSSVEEPGWAMGLNLLGFFTSFGVQALRIASGGSDARDRPVTMDLSTYVRPGPHGTEMGLTLRH